MYKVIEILRFKGDGDHIEQYFFFTKISNHKYRPQNV